MLELPSYKSQQGFIGHASGGWRHNGIISWQSGAHWSGAARSVCLRTSRIQPVRFRGVRPQPSLPATAGTRAATTDSWTAKRTIGRISWRTTSTRATTSGPMAGVASSLPVRLFTAPCLVVSVTWVEYLRWTSLHFLETSLFKIKVTERVGMEFRAEGVQRSQPTPTSNSGAGVQLTTISTTTVLERLAELSTRVSAASLEGFLLCFGWKHRSAPTRGAEPRVYFRPRKMCGRESPHRLCSQSSWFVSALFPKTLDSRGLPPAAITGQVRRS